MQILHLFQNYWSALELFFRSDILLCHSLYLIRSNFSNLPLPCNSYIFTLNSKLLLQIFWAFYIVKFMSCELDVIYKTIWVFILFRHLLLISFWSHTSSNERKEFHYFSFLANSKATQLDYWTIKWEVGMETESNCQKVR